MFGEYAVWRRPMTRRSLIKGCMATLAQSALPVPSAWASELRVGLPAPQATLVTLGGDRIATADLMGSVVVLTFWATWCAPCRSELPLLSAYTEAHRGAPLRILAFSLDDREHLREVEEIARMQRFPVGLLSASSAAGYGRIWRLPVSFTIDRSGRLADNGWDNRTLAWTAERLERVVTPLLA